MRQFYRKVARILNHLTFFPVGNPRTLNLWSFPFMAKAPFRVFTISGLSSFILAIFGIGLHHLIDDMIEPMIKHSTWETLQALLVISSAWIFMVSINHIHEIIPLWYDLHGFMDYIIMIPAYIGVVLIAPFWDLGNWIIHLPFGNAIAFADFSICKEIVSFITHTIPTFGSYCFERVPDLLSETQFWQAMTNFGNSMYDYFVHAIASVIYWLSPTYVRDTWVGTYFIYATASSILTVTLFKVFLWIIGW
jgi:hypothetical protein